MAGTEHQQYDIGVKALIVKNSRVLLLQRQDYDVWELPGGRINKGEDISGALQREIAEELPEARPNTIGGIVHAEQTDFALPNGNRLMLLFFRVSVRLPSMLVISKEHQAVRWLTATELRRLTVQPASMHAALAALGKPV